MMRRYFRSLTLTLTVMIITSLVCAAGTFAQRRRGTQSPRPQPPVKKERTTPTPAPPAAAPTPKCTLDLAQSPELRGFRLGMTVEQVLARVPNLRTQLAERNNEDGWHYAEMGRDDLPSDDREYFNRGAVEFVDGRLSYIEIGYTQVSSNLEEFTKTIAKNFNLPDAWRPSQRMSRLNILEMLTKGREPLESKTLDCNGFHVSTMIEVQYLGGSGPLSNYTSPHVQIEDTVAAQLLAKRRKERDEKERGKFKP